MNALLDELKERIRAQGSIGVDAYMAAANNAYYARRDPLGAEGDFITAPEISQMFGEMVGAALADSWHRAGSPPDTAYVELGPGRGTLAADALRVLRRTGFEGPVHLVETSPVLRQSQHWRVPDAQFHDDLSTVPQAPLLLVANEFLDALPVRQWSDDKERRIVLEEDVLAFSSDIVTREDSPARDAAVKALAERLARDDGVALLIDYGHDGRHSGDTFQAVRAHRFADPLVHPGEQDLTSHVDFGAVRRAAAAAGVTVSRLASQGSWLETLGIGARAAALAAKNPDQTEAIAAARRRLCDEEMMGSLFKLLALASDGWPMIAGLE